jgi:6-pyruvoyltetrahydropterin/6-carboxytetrahydropterin synthase
MMILLTRKAEWSASHYYWVDDWSEEENVRRFGKCANRNGHGHNYTLEVTVRGEVDPRPGFGGDLKGLKDVMEREVVSVYDHRHLNLEVPEFKAVQPTTENIAVAVWRRLAGKVGPGAALHQVRVYETPEIFADFFGEA